MTCTLNVQMIMYQNIFIIYVTPYINLINTTQTDINKNIILKTKKNNNLTKNTKS